MNITILRLIASFKADCHFKIRIVNSFDNNEMTESKHSFKYTKSQQIINMNESLFLQCSRPITPKTVFKILLQVYTKTGYKTAGVGHVGAVYIKNNEPFKVEIPNSPLGEGQVEMMFSGLVIEGMNNQGGLENNIGTVSGNNNSAGIKVPVEIKIEARTQPEYGNINQLSAQNILDHSFVSPAHNNMIVHLPSSALDNSYELKNERKMTPLKPKPQIQQINYNNTSLIKDAQLKELNKKLDYFEQENKDLKSIVNDFKAEKKKISEEKNEIIKAQKMRVEQLTNEIQSYKCQLSDLQGKMTDLRSTQSQNDFDNNEKINKYLKQIEILNNQLKASKLDNISKEQELRNKIERIKQLEQEKNKLSSDCNRKLEQMSNDLHFSVSNNNQEQMKNLREKEEEISKLKIKLQLSEENVDSLNGVINKLKQEKHLNSNAEQSKFQEKLNQKNEEISKLKDKISELNLEKTKIEEDAMNRIHEISNLNLEDTPKETQLKEDILKLRDIITQKNTELEKLREESENLRYENNKLKNSAGKNNMTSTEFNNLNNNNFFEQIQKMQESFKQRENQIIKEKNEEIKKLKERQKQYISNKEDDVDVNKFMQEINKLKSANKTLEEELNYYKELNSKFMGGEKKATNLEKENTDLKNKLSENFNSIEQLEKENKELKENIAILEKELISSKGKLGEVLNELADLEGQKFVRAKDK